MTLEEMQEILVIASSESRENGTEVFEEIQNELINRNVKPTLKLIEEILSL